MANRGKFVQYTISEVGDNDPIVIEKLKEMCRILLLNYCERIGLSTTEIFKFDTPPAYAERSNRFGTYGVVTAEPTDIPWPIPSLGNPHPVWAAVRDALASLEDEQAVTIGFINKVIDFMNITIPIMASGWGDTLGSQLSLGVVAHEEDEDYISEAINTINKNCGMIDVFLQSYNNRWDNNDVCNFGCQIVCQNCQTGCQVVRQCGSCGKCNVNG